MSRDWFAATAHVPAPVRSEVSRQLDAYFYDVYRCAATQLGENFSVCVSGSLARGEPAIINGTTGCRLRSDVDLVVVAPPDPDTEDRSLRFTSALRYRHPQIDTTAFTVHRLDLPRVAGRFGADLHLASINPLVGPALDDFTAPSLGPREGLEGVVHQLATVYGPHSPPGTTPWHVKTMLEAVRAVAAADNDGVQRYSGLASDTTVSALFDSQLLEELVCAREVGQEPYGITARAYEFAITAACRLFGVPEDHRELLDALHICGPGMHLLDGFQAAILAATVVGYGPNRWRRSAASALHTVIAAIDPDTAATSRSCLTALAALTPRAMAAEITAPDRLLYRPLRGLRRDYYGWLGPHNFGARPIPDYHGPALSIPTTTRRSADAH